MLITSILIALTHALQLLLKISEILLLFVPVTFCESQLMREKIDFGDLLLELAYSKAEGAMECMEEVRRGKRMLRCGTVVGPSCS